jgi:hypothetical protein
VNVVIKNKIKNSEKNENGSRNFLIFGRIRNVNVYKIQIGVFYAE